MINQLLSEKANWDKMTIKALLDVKSKDRDWEDAVFNEVRTDEDLIEFFDSLRAEGLIKGMLLGLEYMKAASIKICGDYKGTVWAAVQNEKFKAVEGGALPDMSTVQKLLVEYAIAAQNEAAMNLYRQRMIEEKAMFTQASLPF